MRVINTERIPIKLWLNDIEEEALQQAKNLANLRSARKWIAIMPDSHVGYGMPIGGVLATKKDVVIPNAVGVDINCGVIAARLDIKEIPMDKLKKIMGLIRKKIPLGFNHHKDKQQWFGFDDAPNNEVVQRELNSAKKQLGTLGGGNHFIEIQKDMSDFIWIMIHSGSRNFGLKIAGFYHKKALKFCERWHFNIPNKDLSFLSMQEKEGRDYFEAMEYCGKFARESRMKMLQSVIESIREQLKIVISYGIIDVHHNYASIEYFDGDEVVIHRKGAIEAKKDKIGIIPGSMGTSSYIVKGLGNPNSLYSCSHGAGRKMSRTRAKQELNIEEEQKKMKGVVHGLRNKSDLDEAPGSYKDIDTVMKNQEDLVEIIHKLTPIASIKE
ncbi:MAG: RtcB family protein [Candidatus Heimdallarchaeaceae archaeon]